MTGIRAVCELAAWLQERKQALERELNQALRQGESDRARGLSRGLEVVEGALAVCRQVVKRLAFPGTMLIVVLVCACTVLPRPVVAPGGPAAGLQVTAVDRPRVALPARGEERFVEAVMLVTAYTAGRESTGKSPGHPLYGITASGVKVFPGVVAADPAIPFGTRVWVPGYGHGVVLDRGGAVRGLHLDVYIPDVRAAREWGVRYLPVRIYGFGQELLEVLVDRGQD